MKAVLDRTLQKQNRLINNSNNNNENNASFNHNHILTIIVFAEENLHDSQTVLNVQSILYL